MNDIPIIYQNPEIFIINKKSGMPVQGGEKIAHPLDEELAKQVGQKVYLVHRLDKDTEGLMIVAKTPAAASKWTKLIGKRIYSCVCRKLKAEKGTDYRRYYPARTIKKGSNTLSGRKRMADRKGRR